MGVHHAGLKRNEKRYGIAFVAVSSFLFAGGAVLAYVSLAAGLELLLSSPATAS